jgi:COMPASS component BRE2
MASPDIETPVRDATPTAPSPTTTPVPSSLPQKRALEDDHSPAVSSPLNAEVKFAKLPTAVSTPQLPDETPTMAREKRTKKESLKKRESKGGASTLPAAAGTGEPTNARSTPNSRSGDSNADPSPAELAPQRYKIALPKPTDFEPARGPVFVHHHDVPGPNSRDEEGERLEFFETQDHVYNKKSFHYQPCIADPDFPSSFYYRATEPEPYGAHLGFEDAATHMFFDELGTRVTTNKGFRMCKANVAVREGRWYWECRILRGTVRESAGGQDEEQAKDHGHVRVGWARREAALDAPVGFDAYSYGIRDVEGQKVHMSRPKDFFPAGEELVEGDVIGLEIQLPSEHLHRKVVTGQYNPAVDLVDYDEAEEIHNAGKEVEESADPIAAQEAPNIVRDRIPIRFKQHIYFEQIDYATTKELEDLMNPSPMSSTGPVGSSEPPNPNHPSASLRTLPGSAIRVYKNGSLVGTPFTSLLAFLPPASRPLNQGAGAREGLDDGVLGYYPAVSVFRGGAAEVNFGPRFWFPPPGFDAGSGDSAGGDGARDGDVEMKDAVAEKEAHGVPAKGLSRLRAVAERYEEQIVEDIVYDVIDEVTFWYQDGAKDVDRSAQPDKVEAVVTAPGREEIKGLVQDD